MAYKTAAQQTVNSPLLRPLIGDRHIRSLPNVPLHAKVGNLNEPRKFGGLKIAFYPGCMGDKYYVGMAEACLKVFKHHNVAVYMSSDFACCGIPAVSSGDGKAMVMYLRKNLELLGDVDFDYIVTPCGSCAGTMKEYWPKYAHRIDDTAYYLAKNIAKKTMDVTQFIVDVLGVHAMQPRDNAVDVTYHDSCHLRKGLGVHTQPRELLQANPGYHYVEMKEADRCCGCGGSFTLFHYDLSKQIGQRKRDNIVNSNARIVAAACPACMMQLEDVLASNHDSVTVKHPVEIYAESL